MSADEIPQSDQLDGAPHPRHTKTLFGQDAAQSDFLSAYNSDRLHHAWMITGPNGVGKATLAWRIARFVLSQPEPNPMFPAQPVSSLDTPDDHPIAKRIDALGEPSLYLTRRPWDEKAKRLKAHITVEEIRKLKSFFTLSAADGGWRVAIVDAAEEMNTAAANALLKLLEEPPEKTLILLICHQPARLLPTIRSRCRILKCAPLAPKDIAAALTQADFEQSAVSDALAVLADGSIGRSIELMAGDGIALYQSIVTLVQDAPRMDRDAAMRLANACVGKDKSATFQLTLRMFDLFIARLAKFGALQPQNLAEAATGEANVLAKLAPDLAAARKWARLSQSLQGRVQHANAVNLDPSSVILDMLFKFEETARK
ncbi:DNA polymerase III subunit delta' [Amylibacter marinus]|uniref:DNA polymerase III subunit delta n=1 Tax=Amylibacter marinus TaxID=1475483 RepID=A0ABQ5VRN8_9RHOB|nr:DNA polymerase III subunit delta' [Amylibacter marinus]GLQ33970.1 DNA polymerase III subunit delta' [Amylibacter marinus]